MDYLAVDDLTKVVLVPSGIVFVNLKMGEGEGFFI